MSTPEKKTINILFFGGGSLGGLYSYLLSTSPLANVQTTIICRSNYQTVSTTGYTLTTHSWGNHTFRPHLVISTPTDLPSSHFDYIIVTTKSLPASPLPLSKFRIPETVPIVLIQNGVGIEEPYRAAFPTNPIVSAVTYIIASQPSAGHIHQATGIRSLQLGLFDRPNPADKQEVKFLAELFSTAGLPAAVHEEIQVERWRKLGWNGSWNVLCAVTGLDTQEYIASSVEAVGLVREVIGEIARTANASGVKIDGEALEELQVGRTCRGPSIVPSMLQDARNGVEMEVEALCGNVWRIAERCGVEVPRIKSLYTILAAMNWRFKNAKNTLKV